MSAIIEGQAAVEMSLEDLISDVVTGREVVTTLKAEMASRKKEFDQANAELADSIKKADTSLSAVETELRSRAIASFEHTGNKKPFPGVGIRVSTKLQYDQKDAIQWATENAPYLLSMALDAKAFEAVAKTQSLDFVTVQEVPSATIATDLQA